MFKLVFDFIAKGGIMMFPLIGITLLAYGFIFERFFYLKKQKQKIFLINKVRKLIRKKDFDNIAILLASEEGCISHLLKKGIEYFEQDQNLLEDRLKQVIYEEINGLQKYLSSIKILGSIMPMLGLLGTISGMISVFKAIAVVGIGNPQSLAHGISEALITTQTGLVVAIPTLYFHNYLTDMVNHIIIELKRASKSILNLSRLYFLKD